MRKPGLVANPCAQCGKRYSTERPDNAKRRKYCGPLCAALARRHSQVRQCRKCKQQLPYDSFPRRQGRATTTCQKCFRPHGRPLTPAPHPCKQCGKRFADRKPPCRMASRRYCSTPCARKARRKPERRCSSCTKVCPASEFHCQGGRTTVCEACWSAKAVTRQRGLGYMAPFGQSYRHAGDLARSMGVPFSLSREEAQAIYGQPCDYCGAPGCVLRPAVAGAGYEPGVVSICCWLCAHLTQVRRGGLSEDEVLAYARAVVRHLQT